MSTLLLFHSHTRINCLGKEQTALGCAHSLLLHENKNYSFTFPTMLQERLIVSFPTRYNRTAKLDKQCSFVRTVTAASSICRLMKFPLGSPFYVSVSNSHICPWVFVCLFLCAYLCAFFFPAFVFQVQICELIFVMILLFRYM